MGWNGSGSFQRLFSWAADKAAAINITASRMDGDTNDIVSTGLGNCITRDGQGTPTANLPMSGFRHTNVSSGVVRTDYAAAGQVQDGGLVYAATAGTDTYTAALTPAIPAYVAGQEYALHVGNPNTVTTPTLAINGLASPKTIVRPDGSALIVGDLNGDHKFRYDGANIRVLNPKKVIASDLAAGTATPAITWSGAQAWTGGGSYSGTFSGDHTYSGNLTFSASATFNGAASFAKQTSSAEAALPAVTGTVTLDLSTANNFGGTLTGNITLANPTNPLPGQGGSIRLKQDATGSRTITFGTNWKFQGGVKPPLTTTPAATDILVYYVIDATNIVGTLLGSIS